MYKFSMQEGVDLVGAIKFNKMGVISRGPCPICQTGRKVGQDFVVNFKDGSWGCYRCKFQGRYAVDLYSKYFGMDRKAAYAEMCSRLGVDGYGSKKEEQVRTRKAFDYTETPTEEAKRADIDVLDKTYSELLKVLELSGKNKEALFSRGFSEEEIRLLGYATYPKRKEEGITSEYFNIPKKLLDKSCTLIGVPGFYKTLNKGVWAMQANKGGILVPYRDFHNRIQGLQLRKNDEELMMDEETGEKENKYSWFSSSGKKEGCKASSVIHYACDFLWDRDKQEFYPIIKNGTVVLTEGAMKGDLAHAISGAPFICVPGVSCASKALKENIPLLQSIGVTKIIIAYDMDRLMNINVNADLRSMKKLIEGMGMECANISWSSQFIDCKKEQRMLKTDTDFVFTPKVLDVSPETLEWTLKRVKETGEIKNIFFALSSSKDATPENKILFDNLTKECQKMGLSKPEIIFWSLKLKGVDDYYAHLKRNVQYV